MSKSTKPRYGFDYQQADTLRHKYDRIVHSGIPFEWTSFDAFCKWCQETGWEYGKRLHRVDPSGPYSSENCVWDGTISAPVTETKSALIRQWDEFATPIRERYKPWLDEIERKKPKSREFFRYEHPDLVREGIVFESPDSV